MMQYASEREVEKTRSRMAVAWACGTLRTLGVPFEADGGAWYVCTFWGWEVAETAAEISDIARECLAFKHEMDHAEGPLYVRGAVGA